VDQAIGLRNGARVQVWAAGAVQRALFIIIADGQLFSPNHSISAVSKFTSLVLKGKRKESVMKARQKLLHVCVIVCLVIGWAAYLPAISPNSALASAVVDEAVPPSDGDTPLKSDAPSTASALEIARRQGPEAVVALLDTLSGAELDEAMSEINEAREQLELAAAVPQTESQPLSPEEEAARLQAYLAHEAEVRAAALAPRTDPAENILTEAEVQAPITSDAPAADLTVGSSPCTYATIDAAIAAANSGDRLLLEGNVTFTGNVTINKNLTLRGGYSGCGSGSTARTTLNGGGSGIVVNIGGSLNVTLENLNITNGNNAGASGGGIRSGTGTGGSLTLNHVDLYGNTSGWGAGLWLGYGSPLTANDVDIYNNTATIFGGGVRLYGATAAFSSGAIYDNVAPLGAGLYGDVQDSYAPTLNLPTSADFNNNQALTGSGFGGGVYMAGTPAAAANMYMTDCSDLYSNDAIVGGGAYIISTTLTIEGDCSEIQSNTATGDGGGIFAIDSTINMDDQAELMYNQAGYGGGTGNGGGAYLDNSDLWSDVAQIRSNTADDAGGGVYATNQSLLDMDLEIYTCLGPRCSRLSNNTATNGNGGAVYAYTSEVDLIQTFVENNTSTWGGAIYAWLDPISGVRSVYAYNCLFAKNSGGGTDGIRLWTGGATETTRMIGSHNTLAYNPSAGTGVAIALGGSGTKGLSLSNSIIWGHTTSIDLAGLSVTYSDIQGGYAGTGNINADPLFLSVADSNFHIQTASPAVDQCPTGQSKDFDNAPRPVDLPPAGADDYDMGADEAAARVGLNGAACAYFSIQDAVNAAAVGDTVQVAGDTYYETVDIAKSVTIAGGYDFATCATTGGNATTIDGSAGAGSTVDITDGPVTLRNLTVTGGDGLGAGLDVRSGATTLESVNVTGNNGTNGGGMYIETGATVMLNNYSNVQSNTATSNGGGARVWGTLIGNNATFYNNTALNGGAISLPDGSVQLTGGSVYYNSATGTSTNGNGGGIAMESDSSLTLSDVMVGGNTAAIQGGGIYANSGVLSLSGVEVGTSSYPNEIAATGSAGSGLYLTNGAVASFTDSTIAYNTFLGTGTTYGGGIYLHGGSVVTLTNSTVEYNEAPSATDARGGGMYVYSSTVTLDNSSVHHNVAAGSGGGIRLYEVSKLNVWNGSSFHDNQATAGDGGALAVYANAGTPDINVSDANFYLNSASGNGGAIQANVGTFDFTGWWNLYLNSAGGNGGAAAFSGTANPFFSASGGDSLIFWNQATADGGALYTHIGNNFELYATSGYLLGVAGNHASGNGGAGFADVSTSYSFDVYGQVQVMDNSTDGNGGAFYLSGGATFWADDANSAAPIFSGNTADNGGAIYAVDSNNIRCDGAQFGGANDNAATAGSGGAIYLDNSDLQAENCVFHDNTATLNGGALAAYNASTMNIRASYVTVPLETERPAGPDPLNPQAITAVGCNPLTKECSSFYDNTADKDGDGNGYGGAIYNDGSTLTVDKTYFHGNTTPRGGAIFQTGAGAAATVKNSLIHHNTGTSYGSGIRTEGGSFTLQHTTIANNSGGNGFSGQATTVYNSIVWGNPDGFTVAPTTFACNIDQAGLAGPSTNPYFVAAGSGNFHLLNNSPAINACATNGLSPDLDNTARPQGSQYDMGAYEFKPYKIYLPLVVRYY
jgi:hypothetical protein